MPITNTLDLRRSPSTVATRFVLFASLFLFLCSMPFARADIALADSWYQGNWRVVRVRVSEAGVQARSNNDPAFMNKVLRVNERLISFINERCLGPRLQFKKTTLRAWFNDKFDASPDDFGIIENDEKSVVQLSMSCEKGGIGPQAMGHSSIVQLNDRTIALNYYDGTLLLLTRSSQSGKQRSN